MTRRDTLSRAQREVLDALASGAWLEEWSVCERKYGGERVKRYHLRLAGSRKTRGVHPSTACALIYSSRLSVLDRSDKAPFGSEALFLRSYVLADPEESA